MNKLYLLLLALVLVQCQLFKKPEEPSLPPPTQEGVNQAGCYMNNILWLAGNRSFSFLYDSSRSNTLEIVAYGSLRNPRGSLSLSMLIALEGTQVNQLEQLPLLNKRTYSLGSTHKARIYFSQPQEATSGSITFTSVRQAQIKSVWDYTQQKTFYIVSGTFAFTTSKQQVTQGRFDFSIDESFFRVR